MSVPPEKFVVDTSVWSKAPRFPGIGRRFSEVAAAHQILTIPPQAVEFCYSARNPDEYKSEYRLRMDSFLPAPNHPSVSEVLDLQEALWEVGYVRGAGAIDTLIAAYALVNEATLLCADTDYLLLRTASSDRLKVEYLPEA